MPILRRKKKIKDPRQEIISRVRNIIIQMKDPNNVSTVVDHYEDIIHDIAAISKNITKYEDKVELKREIEQMATKELASLRSTISEISNEINGLYKKLKIVPKNSAEALRIRRRITRLGLHLKLLKQQMDAIERVLDDVKEAVFGMPLTMESMQQLTQYQQTMVQMDQMYLSLAQQSDQLMMEQQEIYDKGVEMALKEVGEIEIGVEPSVEEGKEKEILKELGEEEEKEEV